MNPRTRKEVRSLLPLWGLAVLLATIPSHLLKYPDALFPALAALGFGLVLVAVRTFGVEFGHGTFGILLSQPVSRGELLKEKASVSAIATALVLLAFTASALLALAWAEGPDLTLVGSRWISSWALVAGWALCVGLAAYGGGVASVVLVRQTGPAVWVGLVAPLALITLSSAVQPRVIPNGTPLATTGIPLAIYGLGSLVWAVRYFRGIEDLDRFNVDVGLPILPGVRRATDGARRRGPVLSLVLKELRLQQFNIVITAIIAIVFLVGVALNLMLGNSKVTYSWQLLLIIVTSLVFVIPPLIGAVAIAEERRLGLLEWQQLQPMNRRRLWAVKAFSSVGLALLLSLGLLGFALLGMHLLSVLPMRSLSVQLFAVVASHAFVGTALGLYASSLSRNALQAVGLAIGLALAICGPSALALFLTNAHYPSPAPLLCLIGAPVLVVVMGGCSFWNYRSARLDRTQLARNAAVIAGTVAGILVVTGALFFRTWERLLPEPNPGAGPLTRSEAPPELACQGTTWLVRLPDGSLRGDDQALPNFANADSAVAGTTRPGTEGKEAVKLLKWKTLALDRMWAFGVREDGSLWRWGSGPAWSETMRSRIDRVGEDDDWQAIIAGGSHQLAIKSDGSLWAWGRNNWGQLGDGGRDEVTTPRRVGTDTDWTNVVAWRNRSLGLKRDGSAWTWGRIGTRPKATAWRQPRHIETEGAWTSISPAGNELLAIHEDGSLWRLLDVAKAPPVRPMGRYGLVPSAQPPAGSAGPDKETDKNPVPEGRGTGFMNREGIAIDMEPRFVLVDNSRRWVAASGDWSSNYTIAEDGSLWRWDRYGPRPGVTPPGRRVGRSNAWVALGPYHALAADGSLWRLPGADYFTRTHHQLLVATRHTARVANLLND